jgi:P27 family predicted phage terminase small subunit
MVRGVAPKPKHVLEARGSRRAKDREEIGKLVKEAPDPPEWLKPAAAEMFRRVCGFCIDFGTLAETDTEVITRYAITWERWQEAERALAAGAAAWIEVTDKHGNFRFSRPSKWMSQASQCHEQLRQFETVLGLSPADRTRLGFGARPVDKEDEGEAFFSQQGSSD